MIALGQRLAARGLAVHVVSRGYGGSLAGPVRVEERRHKAAEVGDEPLLLSSMLPVWVARDRAARLAQSAWAVASDGAEVTELVLDRIRALMDGGG